MRRHASVFILKPTPNVAHGKSMHSPNSSQEGTEVHDDQSTVPAVQLALPVARVCSFHIGHLIGVRVAHRMLEEARQRGWDFRRHGIVSTPREIAR
jgi:hypothetical protein